MAGERFVDVFPDDHAGVIAFDGRVDDELRRAASDDSDAIERDRAVWELTRRGSALDVVVAVAQSDPEEGVRRSAMWAALRLGGAEAVAELGATAIAPNDSAWSAMLTSEANGVASTDDRPVRWIDTQPFDETVPLDISGFARVRLPDGTAMEATVSPLWFEHIVGGVTACTVGESFDDTLVIQKRMPGFYPDGRDHVEGFLFKGITTTHEDHRRHAYECVQRHPVYVSGRVGDASEGVIDDAPVQLFRAAETTISPSLTAGAGPYVSSVRGSFHGFAFVRPELVLEAGSLHPGMVQLVSPADPASGHLANTFLYGHFRGMPRDLDGDGQVEANGVAVFIDRAGNPSRP